MDLFKWWRNRRQAEAPEPMPAGFPGDPAALGQRIAEAIRASGVFPGAKIVVGPPMRSGDQMTAVPLAIDTPPTDPGQSWRLWSMSQGEMRLPGWAPCRIANRTGPGDGIGWVYGVARGDFGIWRSPYRVCHHPQNELDESFEPTSILAAVTHLPTGMGMGIFDTAENAGAACDLIQPLLDWSIVPQPDGSEADRAQWRELMTRAHRTLEFNGIDYSPDWHCHIDSSPREYGIWTRKDAFVTANRPEKAS